MVHFSTEYASKNLVTFEGMLSFGRRNILIYFKFKVFYKVSLVIDLEIDFFIQSHTFMSLPYNV